jgi:SAM-dependent methyltransferase
MNNTPRNGRDAEALRRHYLIERELADRLRAATAEQRGPLYRVVYNELFGRVPDHPQLTRKEDPATHRGRTAEQLRLLRPFLRPDAAFLEVGAGDCHLTMAVAAQVRHASGVDVSDVIPNSAERPDNFDLILSGGTDIAVPAGSIDVVYSNMLLEHLHPEDAVAHAREVFRVLAPSGVYVCRTPHRFTGPQDISQFFDEEATGFHMKEYTYRELRDLFRGVGFRSTAPRLRIKGRSLRIPRVVTSALEGALACLPRGARKRLAGSRLLRLLFVCMTVVARKA